MEKNQSSGLKLKVAVIAFSEAKCQKAADTLLASNTHVEFEVTHAAPGVAYSHLQFQAAVLVYHAPRDVSF